MEIDNMLRTDVEKKQTTSSDKLKNLHSSYAPATLIMRDQLYEEFGINIDKCELVEHTFLKLAGVEEKPFKECYLGMHEKSHPPLVFFQLSLRDSQGIKKIEDYAKQNEIKFYNYTHELSQEEQKLDTHLICIDPKGAINKLLPAIIKFLHHNPNELIKYLDKHGYSNSIEESPKPTSYWGGFFNRRTAEFAAGIIGGVVLAAIISNKF